MWVMTTFKSWVTKGPEPPSRGSGSDSGDEVLAHAEVPHAEYLPGEAAYTAPIQPFWVFVMLSGRFGSG